MRSDLFIRFGAKLIPGISFSLLAIFALPALVSAEQLPPKTTAPATVRSPIASHIDQTTLAVIRLDPGRIDWDAVSALEARSLKAAKMPQKDVDESSRPTRQQLLKVKKWVAEFERAGGKSVYVIVRLGSPTYGVVPLEGRADVDALTELLKDPPDLWPLGEVRVERIGKALVSGPPDALADVHDFTPVPRRELELAFADAAAVDAGGDAPICAALSPSTELRALAVLLRKNLPDEVGGGPVAPVAAGLRWVSLAVRPPGQTTGHASLRLTIQAKDAFSADELVGVIDTSFTNMRHQMKREEAGDSAALERILVLLTPHVARDRTNQLRVSVEGEEKIDELAAVLAPPFEKARGSALVWASLSNERRINIAINKYAGENGGRLPANLPTDIKRYLPDDGAATRRTFTNPRQPQRQAGYVYARPADSLLGLKDTFETPLLWEAFDEWEDGVAVGFADGHTEFIEERSEFDRIMKNNRNAAKAQAVSAGTAGSGAGPGRR